MVAGLGVEHFLDLLHYARLAAKGRVAGTPRTIEGPLYVAGAPLCNGYDRMDDGSEDGIATPMFLNGQILDLEGQPIRSAGGPALDLGHRAARVQGGSCLSAECPTRGPQGNCQRPASAQDMGDIIFGPVLGYHYSPDFHAIYAVDIFAPSGEYDRGDLANIGRNYWAFQPIAAFSYVDPVGFNADLKIMYDFNQRNRDTDYRSGQEAHADYSLGWAVGDGWVLGAGGYIYRHTTDDLQGGDTVHNNRGRAFAIGPSIKYSNASGGFVTAKWQKESEARNRPEREAYWLKLTLPL